MIRTGLVALILLLAACDFSVPLAEKPELPIDESVAGLWQRTTENHGTQRLLILPLNRQEYLVSFPAGTPKALFARAWRFHFDGREWLQIRWIGTAEGKQPDNEHLYQIASYRHEDNRLAIRLLNGELIGRQSESSDELARAIRAHQGNPKLFRKEMVFRRLPPDIPSPR